MALNSFRGDAEPRSKIVRLQSPSNTIGINPVIRINNKSIRFSDWNAATIANSINASSLAEFAGIEAIAVDGNVDLTGPVNDDFDVSFEQTPTATVSNTLGANPLAQMSRISFNGATSGTYTLTLDGETTAAITLGDIADARTKIAALASFSSSDFTLTESGADYILEFKGSYFGSGVVVSIDGGNLTNISGTLVTTQKAAPTLSRYDSFQFAMRPSNSAVIDIDGNTDRIYSDDSLAVVREKIQALATGGKTINVYGGQIGAGVSGAVWIVEFQGYDTTTRPTFSIVSSIVTNGAEIQPIYDVVSSDFVEHVMVDFSESAQQMVVRADGAEVELIYTDDATVIATKLNNASQYGEWQAFSVASTFLHTSTIGAVTHPKIQLLRWVRSDLYDESDIPDSYLTKISGGSRFKTLANGGTNVSGSVFEIYRTPNTVSGGTWTLTLTEGTTTPIAWNADAATVEAAVAAVLSGSTCDSGSGSAAIPWRITLGTSATPYQTPTTAASFTGQGTASTTITRARFPGISGRAIVSVSTRAVSGTYSMIFGSEGPVAFSPGIDAAAFKTVLQLFPTLADTADVAVEWDEDAGTYLIEFQNNLGFTALPKFEISAELNRLATDTDETNAVVIQSATGPGCFGEPLNWTAGRLPECEDHLMIDSAVDDIRYGMRQYVASEAHNGTVTFEASGGHDFLPNQKVRIFGDVIPSSFFGNTDYYVVAPDYSRRTFGLAESVNGVPISISGTGTGLYIGVVLKTAKVTSMFTRRIGLEETNAGGYREYRNRYLTIGVSDTVDIGEGQGQGSGLIRINFGDTGPVVRVVSTASPSETGFPAVNFLAQSDELRLGVMEGVAGVAAGDDEESTIADAGLHGGETQFGTVTITRDLLKANGAMTSRELRVLGFVREN